GGLPEPRAVDRHGRGAREHTAGPTAAPRGAALARSRLGPRRRAGARRAAAPRRRRHDPRGGRVTDPGAGLEVAYLASAYPKISHAFIQREVQALRRQGVVVTTYSLRAAPNDEVVTDDDHAEAAATQTLQPVRWGEVLRSHGWALVRHPL